MGRAFGVTLMAVSVVRNRGVGLPLRLNGCHLRKVSVARNRGVGLPLCPMANIYRHSYCERVRCKALGSSSTARNHVQSPLGPQIVMCMTRITSPAIRIEQDGKPVFLASFTVANLMTAGFCRADQLDAETADGYQRVIDERRARSFAKDVSELGENAFLPTSLFLATDKQIAYDPSRREISFEVDPDNPFFLVVDGQHRTAGLKMAAMKDGGESLREFAVPQLSLPV